MDAHINFDVQSVTMLFGGKTDMWLERLGTYQPFLGVIASIHLCPSVTFLIAPVRLALGWNLKTRWLGFCALLTKFIILSYTLNSYCIRL